MKLTKSLTASAIVLMAAMTWLLPVDSEATRVPRTVFVDEFGDRVDVVILVGGFDTKKMFGDIYRRIERFSKMNLEQGLYDRELWNEIMKKLLGELGYLPSP